MEIGCPEGGRSSVHRYNGMLLGRTIQSCSLQVALMDPDPRRGGWATWRHYRRAPAGSRKQATLQSSGSQRAAGATLHLDGRGRKEQAGEIA